MDIETKTSEGKLNNSLNNNIFRAVFFPQTTNKFKRGFNNEKNY